MTETNDASENNSSLPPLGEDSEYIRSTMWTSQYPNFGDPIPQRRRSDVKRFQINYRTFARITKISMGVNLAIFLFFSFMYLPHVPRHAPISDTDEAAESEVCHKHMAVFGIREFWFTFCTYNRFHNYKYLVQFPRTFECKEIQCTLTMDFTETPADLRGKDIVLFTRVDEWLTADMWDWAISNRTEGQRWVMVTEESPLYVPGISPPQIYAKTAFDWIGSYKSDSDFVQPYGYYTPFRGVNRPGYVEFDAQRMLAEKKKLPMVLWLGSHCETLQWNRIQFVKDLEDLVPMKKYGKCAYWPEEKGEFLQWNNETVIKNVLSQHKFYLSLENSCCTDYVSEKFWRTMQYDIVPIVIGPPLEDYERLAPPNSFIHPDQFDSMMDMAMHIVELATDDQKYLEYFEWKKRGNVFVHSQEEYYLYPLKNDTNCGILKKFLQSSDQKLESPHQKLDYFGPKWHQSCGQCSRKSWLRDTYMYMHPPNYLE